MNRPLLGYLILTVFTVVLVGLTAWNAWHENIILSIAFFPFVALLVYVLRRVYLEARGARNAYPLFSKRSFYDFLSTALGAVFTYIISVHAGAGAVVASGIAGVVAALFARPYAVPIFCGSFLGMSSSEYLQMEHMLVASVIVGIVFVLTKDVFNGYGGKLGTIALSAAVIGGVLLGRDFLEGAAYSNFEALALIVFSILGAVVTFVISVRYHKGPVFASGIVGVASGLALPFLIPDFGVELAVVAFGASFVGMSSKKRLLDERYIAVAGLLFGFIFVFSAPYFDGAGGKLGTIAFASSMMMGGMSVVLKRVKKLSWK